MSALPTPLDGYARACELHETRANHLAIVEAEIAAFWESVRPSPAAVSDEEQAARARRIARLMAERGAVLVVERQAYEALGEAITRLVATLPAGEPKGSAGRLLDGWAAREAGLRQIDAGDMAVDTAHRAMTAALRALLDPLVAQRSPFTA